MRALDSEAAANSTTRNGFPGAAFPGHCSLCMPASVWSATSTGTDGEGEEQMLERGHSWAHDLGQSGPEPKQGGYSGGERRWWAAVEGAWACVLL